MQTAPAAHGAHDASTAPAAGLLGDREGRSRLSASNAAESSAGLPVLAPGSAIGAGAGQGALQGTAQALDTLETKRGKGEASALDRIRDARRRTYATAQHLHSRGGTAEPVLMRAAGRLQNCSVHGLFRSHNDGVNHLVGRALCRCRVCPNCQEALATKRKHNAEAFFEANEQALTPFYFYHMVLTVRHSKADNVRTGLYTGDVVQYFAALRGQGGTNDRAGKTWWNDRVAGSLYSVELTAGRDGSPHIHSHVLLMARRPLWRADGKLSAFVATARDRWQKITGDSTGVFLEPVYTLDSEGNKQYYSPRTSGPDALRRAVAECAKYTLKTETAALAAFPTSFIRDLLTTRNRYFGRTGILTKKGGGDMFEGLERLNTNFKDLKAIAEREAETLYNPATGATVPKEETRLLITPFANVLECRAAACVLPAEGAAVVVAAAEGVAVEGAAVELATVDGIRAPRRGGETYWVLRDPRAAVHFGSELTPDVQVFLAQTIRRRYDPRADVGALDDEPPALTQAVPVQADERPRLTGPTKAVRAGDARNDIPRGRPDRQECHRKE